MTQPRVTGGWRRRGRDPGRVSTAGFEKRRVCRRPGRVRWAGVPARENREPRDGLRGRTAGADGASRSRYRAVGPREERGGRVPSDPLRAEALPGRRGEPAGRGNRPPERRREAGRRGPSDGGSRLPIDQCFCRREPQFGPGCTLLRASDAAPRRWATTPEVGRGRCPEACVFENWVSEIVRMVAWEGGAKSPGRKRKDGADGPGPFNG